MRERRRGRLARGSASDVASAELGRVGPSGSGRLLGAGRGCGTRGFAPKGVCVKEFIGRLRRGFFQVRQRNFD